MAGLVERLASDDVVVAAEGYLMELERRGYNRHGSFVPTVYIYVYLDYTITASVNKYHNTCRTSVATADQ